MKSRHERELKFRGVVYGIVDKHIQEFEKMPLEKLMEKAIKALLFYGQSMRERNYICTISIISAIAREAGVTPSKINDIISLTEEETEFSLPDFEFTEFFTIEGNRSELDSAIIEYLYSILRLDELPDDEDDDEQEEES